MIHTFADAPPHITIPLPPGTWTPTATFSEADLQATLTPRTLTCHLPNWSAAAFLLSRA